MSTIPLPTRTTGASVEADSPPPAVSPWTDSLFQEPWWLDAVAPGRWRAVTIERSGAVVARLPYVLRQGMGLTFCELPPLTQTLGPWVAPAEGGPARRLATEKELMGALIDGLPAHDRFDQCFNYAVTNWMPFHWKGFRQTTRYTYVIDDIADPDRIWAGFDSAVRTKVRKAEKKLAVRSDLGADALYDVVAMTFARQGLPVPYEREVLRRVVDTATARDQGRAFFAEDAEGRIHGAIFIVHDERSAFGLVSGSNPDLRNSGSNTLLVWNGLKYASGRARIFDFEGSMLEPVEQAIRAYGGLPRPYFRITRFSRRMRAVEGLKEIAKAALGRP